MNCSQCQQSVTQMRYDLKIGAWLCKACAPAVPDRYDARIKHSWSDAPGSISVGHLEDIKRRVYDHKTGEIRRDTGRKYI